MTLGRIRVNRYQAHELYTQDILLNNADPSRRGKFLYLTHIRKYNLLLKRRHWSATVQVKRSTLERVNQASIRHFSCRE